MKKIGIVLVFMLCILFTGCGSETSETISLQEQSVDDLVDIGTEATFEESIVVTHKLYFDVNVTIPEDVLNEHTVELYLDESLVHKFEDNKYYTELIEAEEGDHTVSLKFDEQVISDLNQSIDLKADMSAAFVLGYGENVDIISFEIKDSIADSAIVYDDMSDVALDKAMEELSTKHFVNVRYVSNDDTTILDLADWIVVKQNITPGTEIDKAEEIVLTCRKVYFQLYFDLSFDENLFLATYDIDVYLDDQKIDTIPHGKSFTYLTKLKEGDHAAVFYKATDNSVYSEKKINISTDSTLSGRLHSNSKDIELNDFILKNEITNTTFEVANVTGMRLDKALELLGNIGFTNIVKENSSDIWIESNWIVTSQSVAEGENVDKNTKIVLTSVKKEVYLADTYSQLNIIDATKRADDNKQEITYVDYAKNMYMTNKISAMDDNEKKLWIVKQAMFDDSGKIQLNFIYTGSVEMPNVVDANLADALISLKNAEFSDVESKAEDGGYIWDNSDWKVVSQSVLAGASVKANQKIILTVADKNATSVTTSATSSAKEEDKEEKNEEKTESASKSDVSNDKSNTSSVDDEIENLMIITELDLIARENSSGIHYSISRDGDTVYINLWQDGLAEGAGYVMNGTLPKSQWTSVIDSMKSYSSEVYAEYKPYKVNVVVNLLNNLNKENTLATFKNGKKVYDVVG